ncbi:MAG TPA: DNA polymerase III subunit beta [Gammaproteobacteria bacterium]|jgi:DNA polymerase-3 subunit beta|nr:DNA polymerase III subunit beta [Gammaproteobacteria bacterium]
MKFEALRDTLLKPVQAVVGVVERRQTMPILANVLLTVTDKTLSVTATDLEVELVAEAEVDVKEKGEVTVPARKLLDICRALPEGAKVSLSLERDKVTVKSGRSRFLLATLPAAEFPAVEDIKSQRSVNLAQKKLRELIEQTHFSMAQQDVRYYLNGLLFELSPKRIRTVATDGHRLAMYDLDADVADLPTQQVIVPRKGVLELQRLLTDSEDPAKVSFGTNHVRVELPGLRFTSKLIDGRFPDYERVVPKAGDKDIVADRQVLRDALGRTAILSNEKYRGVRLQLAPNRLKVMAHNPEQEEAEDEVEVKYQGAELEIGFNVSYLMDALSALHTEQVRITLTDSNSSCLIRHPDNDNCRYVVMPMRL